MLSYFQGTCCPEHELIQPLGNQNLVCTICYQVMTHPVKLNCGYGHTFGMACIAEWLNKQKKKQCPYCRADAKQWTIDLQLKQQAAKLKTACAHCKKWCSSIKQLESHYMECSQYKQHLQNRLKSLVQEEIAILDQEINPHLELLHKDIYQKYVEKWEWLSWDTRDWKWWWWAHNPWWNGSCNPCNKLWHKYEKKVDLLEAQRKQLIEKLNTYTQIDLEGLFKEPEEKF